MTDMMLNVFFALKALCFMVKKPITEAMIDKNSDYGKKTYSKIPASFRHH